jgi:hypothetical protein
MIATLQVWIYFGLYLFVFVLSVVALVDAARRTPKAFLDAGKRTKSFWLGLLIAATLVAFVAIPGPIGLGLLSFLALVSAVAAGVYLVDVRPAVSRYSGGGRGPRGPQGGW